MTARREIPALDLIEEAGYLLRNAPAGALAAYYIGTLPFLLGFLFFWADMAGSVTAYDRCAPAALGLAALFLWMSTWQAAFAQRLRSRLTGAAPPPVRKFASLQCALQPTKLIVIPIALVVTIPLAATIAFYQNLAAVPYEEGEGIGQAIAAAWRRARLWPRQNWVVQGIVMLLAVAVFLNVAVALLLAPQLLKSFLGIETALAQGEVSPFNSTFLAIALALSYAIVDPLVKAVYVMRCFHGESLATGEDLRSQIKSIARQAVTAALAIALCCGALLRAEQPAPSVHDLDHSIDRVLTHDEFAWRLPHAHRPENKNWFERLFDSWMEHVGAWLNEFINWLHEHFRSKSPGAPQRGAPPSLQLWYYALIGGAVLICVLLLILSFRKRSRAKTVAAEAVAAEPDLASDATGPDQLPADEWLVRARECVARGDLRLAVRALYLATLAHLGASSLIAIDRGKSNEDYARELRRRARSKPVLLAPFTDTIAIFERSWYGMYEVNGELVERVEANLASISAQAGGGRAAR